VSADASFFSLVRFRDDDDARLVARVDEKGDPPPGPAARDPRHAGFAGRRREL
jgi:hypothetical protein